MKKIISVVCSSFLLLVSHNVYAEETVEEKKKPDIIAYEETSRESEDIEDKGDTTLNVSKVESNLEKSNESNIEEKIESSPEDTIDDEVQDESVLEAQENVDDDVQIKTENQAHSQTLQKYSSSTKSITSLNSPDDWLKEAEAQTSISNRLNIYVEGYHQFPEDERFIEGIRSSALGLLSWARSQHLQGNYTVAINRYEQLLSTPKVEANFLDTTRIHLSYAVENKPVPSAQSLYNYAKQQSKVSSIFTSFMEGYKWYPEDTRFINGIHTSSENLFAWAIRKHDEGDFFIALERYKTILGSPVITENLKKRVEQRIEDAEIGKRPAQSIYEQAINEPSASKKLDLFIEGYNFYSNDVRFENGILSSTQSLFNWSVKQHNSKNYDIAIDRYNTILKSPVLTDKLKATTEVYLEYALEKKIIPSAENLYHRALNQTQVSAIFLAYLEAHELYPSDSRFTEGLLFSAQQLFNWSKKKHDEGNFSTAIDRYQMLLDAPLEKSFKEEIESKKADAEIGKRPANVIIVAAKDETSASGKLDLYLEGRHFYPDDSRFEEGVQKSSRLLLDWTTKQHNLENYEVALNRYRFLSGIPNISSTISNKVSIQVSFAEKNEKIPNSDGFYTLAMSNNTLTGRMTILLDGYTLHGSTQQLIVGINDTAKLLLNWASNQHETGNITTAKDRYKYILSVPKLFEDLKIETTIKLQYAEKGQAYPSPQQLFEIASSQSSATHMLNKFEEGYILYPDDKRFIEGLSTAAEALMNWATNQHQAGSYATALDRYNRILNTPEINQHILIETEFKKEYAVKKMKFPTANQLYNLAVNDTTATGKLQQFIFGYITYKDDQRFPMGVNNAAANLLNWTLNQHERMNFDVAAQRYRMLIEAPGVSLSIKESAERNLTLAEARTIPTREIINFTRYNISFDQALNIQMSLGVPPQTDAYSREKAYIQSTFIKDIKSTGVSVETARIRTTPRLDGTIYKTVSAGTSFEIIGIETGDSFEGSTDWYKIKFEKNTLYIHSALAEESLRGQLTAKASVYDRTSTTGHKFGGYVKDDFVVLKSINNSDWYEVQFGTWRNARRSDVEPLFNPNNNDMFQHLVLNTSTGVSSSQLDKLLTGKGILQSRGQTFIEAGLTHGVNEVYLISHALLETGHGSSPLATGIEVGMNSFGKLELVTSVNRLRLTNIKTTYNMFGIGAIDGDAHRQGAFKAYNEKWFSPDEAIIGGARFIGERYIHNAYGQNTLYKMRWNPINPGYPQYATDMGWALKQLPNIKSLYSQLEDPILHFDIPQYN